MRTFSLRQLSGLIGHTYTFTYPKAADGLLMLRSSAIVLLSRASVDKRLYSLPNISVNRKDSVNTTVESSDSKNIKPFPETGRPRDRELYLDDMTTLVHPHPSYLSDPRCISVGR